MGLLKPLSKVCLRIFDLFQDFKEEKVIAAIGDGEILKNRGAKIWYKVAGAKNGPATIFLHGGPGYNSYSFEKHVGRLLEKKLRMVYMDQRDCGRSTVSVRAPVDIQAIVEDIEQIRIRSNLLKVNLLGHSFGGLIALEYFRHYPAFVNKIVLIDISFDLPAAFRHQIDFATKKFLRHSDALRKLDSENLPLFKKVSKIWEIVGAVKFQQSLLWRSREPYQVNRKFDIESNLFPKGNRFIRQLERDGYLNSPHPELAKKIPVPTLMIAGRHSQCIGAENICKAASIWETPIIWFDESGHFPYAEESQPFAKTVTDFFKV